MYNKNILKYQKNFYRKNIVATFGILQVEKGGDYRYTGIDGIENQNYIQPELDEYIDFRKTFWFVYGFRYVRTWLELF